MKENRKRKIFSVLVVGLLVLSVLTAATAALGAEQSDPVKPSTEEEGTETQEYNKDDMPSEEELKERIDNIMKDFEKNGPPEKELDVVSEDKLDLLKGMTSSNGNGNALNTDPHTKEQHHVDEVQDMGIKGEGVKVSFMDTGFDMAQPDLQGKHAVFEYDSDMPGWAEQYDGHPIAYDPVSMADYVYDGEIGDNSWYVDTSYEAEAWNTTNRGMLAQYEEKSPDSSIYELPDEVEEGDTVRFGEHPDMKLEMWYGEKPAVLLTQNDDGDWANVYTDLDNDRSFEDETPAYINGTDRDSECISQDIDGDGISDISGGIAYFIANENEDGDNMPIPYSQNFRDAMNNLLNLLSGVPPGSIEAEYGIDAWEFYEFPEPQTSPEPGDMVALMGDFNAPGSMGAHGTWTASAVAGQGVTGVPDSMIVEENGTNPVPPDPSGGDGLVQGLAPDTEVIPMGHFFDYPDNPLAAFDVTYTSYFFAAEGYDGDVSTHSDQAQIASSSFGSSGYLNTGGYNYYDRLIDYVGTQYTENTLYVNSEGNEGSGFGTEGSPSGGQGILSVGAASNQYYRVDPWNDYDKGPNPWAGEATGMSSSGPDAIGAHGPDILANGQFGYGGDPLNNHAFSEGEFQGNNSWTLWSGTSLAAPNAAGIAALVYQAYNETHGVRPDSQMVKDLVMQGADDIKNTPFTQGPGTANALKSVNLAQEMGVLSSTSEFRPGTNPTTDTRTEHSVNMMKPGESYNETFELENRNMTDSVEYEMSATQLEKEGSTTLEMESGSADDNPVYMINETGIYNLTMDSEGNYSINDEPEATLDAPNADLFRFGAHTPFENLGATSLVEYYDWTDVNDDDTYNGTDERNRIIYNYAADADYSPDQTSDYASIYDAMERVSDGMIIQVRNYDEDPSSFEFNLTIDQYNQNSWDWIDIGNATGEIGAGNITDYNLEATVPADAPKGFYEGKVMIDDVTNDQMHTIPVTITVGQNYSGEDAENLDMKFGAG
ncbi:MAG: S8 family serine peptidase, partial [Thermoplasmata archaeon]